MNDRHELLVQELADMLRQGQDAAAVDAILTRVAPEYRDEIRAEAERQSRAAEHEGALEEEVGDTAGPGAGFNDEPVRVKEKGGVIT